MDYLCVSPDGRLEIWKTNGLLQAWDIVVYEDSHTITYVHVAWERPEFWGREVLEVWK